MDAPNLLDYGPPPKRKYSFSRRDLAGAVFILLSIPAGFLAIMSIFAVISRAVISQPAEAPGFWEVVGYAGGFGSISALLCFFMVRSAVRRLRPATGDHHAPARCDSISR